jgi:hypothetical protein
MKKLFGFIESFIAIAILLVMVVIAISCPGTADAAVLPIPGAGGDWTADAWIRNTSSDTVVQKIGHLTYTRAGFDPVVIESTITLKPGETRRFANVEQFYDAGMWVLQLDARLEASAFMSFRGNVARFEVNALTKAITQPGDGVNFYRIAIDPASSIGTFPTIVNDSKVAAQVEMILYGPDGVTKIADVFATAAPGISQFILPGTAPNGGSVRICHTACGIGLPAPAAALYAFVPTGPENGGMQALRYPQ